MFDTRRGAVVLTEGVEVRSGTRLEGPLFVGPGTVLLGASCAAPRSARTAGSMVR